jgi:CheY-like chemotaxis protein
MAPLILVVEDEYPIRRLIASLLEDEGYEVASTASGEAAVEWARTHRPALVLLDMMLPEMDGGQVGWRLFELYGPTVPIIVVSAMNIGDVEAFRMELGAFGVLLKPFDLQQLVELVHQGLDESRRRLTAPL